mmetsp:Transcript_1445/g.1913  ORF Transcript_1445/g.1913 Transcript_1445/m.1913 type:complete len:144 (+) Transcript_1445:16-447(+)
MAAPFWVKFCIGICVFNSILWAVLEGFYFDEVIKDNFAPQHNWNDPKDLYELILFIERGGVAPYHIAAALTFIAAWNDVKMLRKVCLIYLFVCFWNGSVVWQMIPQYIVPNLTALVLSSIPMVLVALLGRDATQSVAQTKKTK